MRGFARRKSAKSIMNLQNCFRLDEPRHAPAVNSNQNRVVVTLLRCGCVAALLIAVCSASAQDIFMRIGGQAAAMGSTQTAPTLAGESTDLQYTNWIPVLSMSHGISRSVTIGGGGTTGGLPNHSDVSLTKMLDKTTPSLNLLVNGVTATVTQPIDYVTIDFRKSGTTQVYYRIELQGVYLTSASISGSAGGGLPSESVTLTYTRIKWSYVPYVNGKAQTPITKGWDLAKNVAI